MDVQGDPLPAPFEPADPIRKASRSSKRLNILVVEDDENLSEIMVMLLRELGHEVFTASLGLNAVEIAWSQQPDVVLLDLRLPDIDGLEVARRLRDEGYDGLIVAVTAMSPEQLPAAQLSQAALDEHLIKPVSFSSLQDLFDDTEASL